MTCIRHSGGRAALACSVVGIAIGACAPLRLGPPPPSGPPEAAARSAGGKVFDKWCSDCHANASGPGSMALQRKYQGSVPAVLEQRNNLPPEAVTLAVRHGASFMPSFRKTEISDAELGLVADYLAKRP